MRMLFGVLIFSLSACGEDKDANFSNGNSTEVQEVTYYKDIQPIMATHCTRCHTDNGLGPGDFTSIDEVTLLADVMLSDMVSGLMPPPTSDPTCRDYVGSEHLRLSPEAESTFTQWVQQGKKPGDPNDAVSVPEIQTELSEPDLEFLMTEPYTPTFERDDQPNNEYRCFILETTELEGQYITAVGANVDVDEMMHHITLSFVDKSQVSDEFLSPQGWDCIDDALGFPSEQMFAGFAPGTMPLELPEGSGFYFGDDKYLILAMHYVWNSETDGASDQTGFDFNVSDEIDTPLYMVPLGVDGFAIPPGAVNYSESEVLPASWFGDFEILTVLPHMHALGRGYDMRLIHADGTETCALNGDYDFDNQIGYQFKEPLQIESGDLLSFECTWDNPTDETVSYGERTDEEMCIFFSIVSF